MESISKWILPILLVMVLTVCTVFSNQDASAYAAENNKTKGVSAEYMKELKL